ncbi:DCL family protein [Streptomyces virginiae]
MPAKPVMIGDRYYSRKGDADEAVRAMLYRYQPGEKVSAPEDEALLHDLLELHEDSEKKRGVGIAHFEVRLNEFRKPGFHIIRTDGSDTDFSFKKCLTPATQRKKVLGAMRRAVKGQVLAAKNAAVDKAGGALVPCALTGELLTDDAMHVDHYDPDFNELATAYAEERGGWNAFPLVSGVDNTIGSQFVDDAQREEWEAHHQQHANLRVISVQANLSLRRRGVKRKAV